MGRKGGQSQRVEPNVEVECGVNQGAGQGDVEQPIPGGVQLDELMGEPVEPVHHVGIGVVLEAVAVKPVEPLGGGEPDEPLGILDHLEDAVARQTVQHRIMAQGDIQRCMVPLISTVWQRGSLAAHGAGHGATKEEEGQMNAEAMHLLKLRHTWALTRRFRRLTG